MDDRAEADVVIPDGMVATAMLVDDHAVVRAGIRLLLESEPGVSVVAEASSADEALQVPVDRDPDLIVTDLSMDGLHRAAVVEALAERFPNARILVLSMVDSPTDIRRAIDAGASGYMLKGGSCSRAPGSDRPDPER
ncbi:MAG TPA: response regulator transcription factor [Actinomycetota bacterium]|nr:response regulator transcription factor [Actinomycetota bacterium]